jgi:hypothetical protein
MNQRFNFFLTWEGSWKKSQGFKPDLGKPAVRDYRGAEGNVARVGTVHPSCNRKSRNGNPPPTAGRALALSQPKPVGRDRLQTTLSCCGQKPWW